MRRLSLAVVLALAAVLSASCSDGGGGQDDSPLAVEVRRVAETTAEAESAQVFTELQVETKAEGKKAQKVTIVSEGVWSFAKSEGRQSLSVAGRTTESITKGGSFYTEIVDPKDPARKWSRIPASGGARLGTNDPEQAIKLLLGASDVEKAGTETVREAETTKYTMDIDVDAAADRLPESEGDAFKQQLQGRDSVPATVWVDEEGRMRRLRYTLATDKDGARSSIVATMELFDFGVEVQVTAPSEDEIQLPG